MENETTYRVEKCDSKVQWDEFVLDNGGHPLQLWGWGDLKKQYKWQVERFFIVANDEPIGAVQLLVRKLPKPFSKLLYIPRGPVIVDGHETEVYRELAAHASSQYRGAALLVEPDSDTGPEEHPWQLSTQAVLSPSGVILDLSKADGVLRAGITQEGREALRIAAEHNLTVKKVSSPEDIAACLALRNDTDEKRHNDQYYRDLHDTLGEYSVLFGCWDGEQLIACVWLLVSEASAFELWSAVNDRGREYRAEYLLAQEAIRRCKQWGIGRYIMADRLYDAQENRPTFSAERYLYAETRVIPLSWLYPVWRSLMTLRQWFRRR